MLRTFILCNYNAKELTLAIIKGHLRAKIRKKIVQRRKVKYQLKVC